jgi:hypothetical protein
MFEANKQGTINRQQQQHGDKINEFLHVAFNESPCRNETAMTRRKF